MSSIYLDVPYISQTGDPTGCWYASTCMVGYYFEAGPRLGNPDMYKRILGTDAAGRPLLGHFAISGEAEKRWLANEHLEVVPVPPSKAWTGDDIALLLRQYGPLCVSWFKTAKGSTYGHVSVIVGYDESSKEVIIHDPENRPRWRQKLADFNKTFMWGDPRPLVRRSGPAMQQRALTDLPPIGPLLRTSP